MNSSPSWGRAKLGQDLCHRKVQRDAKSASSEATLWLFNIAMENDPFIDSLPINSMVDLSMANC